MPDSPSSASVNDPRKIGEALDRILASAHFANAPALGAFLRYVVAQVLEGKASGIKAYTIGVEALGRPATFDPQTDPIVRIQAGRLRKALALYYGAEGRTEPLQITLPSGSYVPRFAGANGRSPDNRLKRWWPLAALAAAILAVVGIFLFADGIPLWRFASPAGEAFHDSPLPTVQVEIRKTQNKASGAEAATFRNALEKVLVDYDETIVVAPGVQKAAYHVFVMLADTGNNGARADIEVIDNRNGQKIASLSRSIAGRDKATIEDAAGWVAADLAQPYGVILSAERNNPKKTDDIDCVLRAFDYLRRPGKEELQHARVCLKWMVTSRPTSHVAYALLSNLLLDPYRDGYKPRSPAVFERALDAARMAVKLAPESSRSHQALMNALFLSGFPDQALEEGRRAYEFNPYYPEIGADYACELIYRGKYNEGWVILESLADKVTVRPVYFDFCQFVLAYIDPQHPDLGKAFAPLEGQRGMLALMAGVLYYTRTGNAAKATQTLAELIAFSPGFERDPRAMLLRRGWSENLVDQVLGQLRMAGLSTD